MAEQWEIDGPKVLDIGGEGETVLRLKVGLVGGHVDIVTHDDSSTARLEVHEVTGRPLQVTWTGSTLRVSHVPEDGDNLFETLKQRFASLGNQRLSARVSLSVPSTAEVSVSTVSADALVNGVRAEVRANTVSGGLTLDDIAGDVRANTVSGEVECHGLSGNFTGKSVSGPVTVQASRLGAIKLNTVSGDIALDLTSGAAQISSNSVSGDVTVRIPAGGGFDVTAHTASGQVVIDGKRVTLPGSKRPGGQLSEGDRALAIKANAISGNVVVLRAAGGAAPQDRPQDSPRDTPQDTPQDIPGDTESAAG